MSIIFGIRKPQGALVSEQELIRLSRATGRYISEGTVIAIAARVGMGFQPLHAHSRSKLERGPISDARGNLLAIDGRLDNYRDLCQDLNLDKENTPDSEIILAAYLRWGTACFGRFIGDWALALWSMREQVLYLARDHAGTRTLYYESRNGTLLWSTFLDSFFADPRSIEVDEDYAACYLGGQPIRDLTPYKSMRAVLPAHYVVAREDQLSSCSHWQWMRSAQIRYNSDHEYEEHLTAVLGKAVERRDTPDFPSVAQLSGGMDSTSIVCMSDRNRKLQNESAELIDTISFYDDSESSSDERPYFAAVETKRGKCGAHVSVSFLDQTFEPHDSSNGIYLFPGADSSTFEQERKIQAAIGTDAYHSILSGIGGDEVLGGVPSSRPELADYLLAGNIPMLLKQTCKWCFIDRTPFHYLLFDTAKYAYDLYCSPQAQCNSLPPWIAPSLREACARTAIRNSIADNLKGLTPTSISNGIAWWSVMETLPHIRPGILSRPEYRYPYLDRDLVEYLFSVPSEQLVRPGRRRSLMRRALKDIVPDKVLERRRKGYVIQSPLAAIDNSRETIDRLFADAFICDEGFVDHRKLQAALDLTTTGGSGRWWQMIARAIAYELWIKERLTKNGIGFQRCQQNQFLPPKTEADKIRAVQVAS